MAVCFRCDTRREERSGTPTIPHRTVSPSREKEMGTMEILLVSPLKPIQIIVGKVVAYIVLAFINAITILLLGNFVFGIPIQGSIILLLVECMLYIILSLCLVTSF